MEFDAARVVVLAGDPGDVVARFPGVVCVARCPEPELLRTLLRLCADASGPDPGRGLARSLARWLAGEDDLPERVVFGTVSIAEDQLAVFLSGAAAVEVDSTILSGTDAAAWTDRLLAAPSGSVRLALQGAADPAGAVPDVLDLRGGVVPGAGAVLVPGSQAVNDLSRPASSVGFHPPERPMAPAAEARAPQREPRPHPQPVGRSPLAPDPAPPQRPPGNGVAPSIDVRKAAGPARPQPVPQVPERPDEPGADEEFSSGEWFGAAGAPEQEPEHTVHDDGSPWVAPPPSVPPSAAPSADQPPSVPPGRHAVQRPVEATEGRTDVVDDAGELPTPRNGDALVSATVGAVPDARSGEQAEQAGSAPSGSSEQQPESQAVPTPRSAPSDQAAGVAVAGRNGEQNGDAAARPGAQQVQGRECPRGHLNDPRTQVCGQCGARVDERAALVTGVRPALGVLVFDDGSSYTVDAAYLVGRMPESDQRVSAGELRPIVVEDRSGAVSRVHAEVRVDGWDVLLADSGSRNGTFVAGPAQQGWSPLPPGRSRRLVPGTRVRIGGRTFVFEAPGGAS